MSKFRFGFISVFADAILVNVAAWLSFLIRFGGHIPAYNLVAFGYMWIPLTVIYLGCGWIYGLYEPERMDTPWSITRSVLVSTSFATLLVTAYAFLGGAHTAAFARWTLVLLWVFALVFLLGWRLTILRLLPIRFPRQRTVILGTNQVAADLARSLREREKWGWNFIGYVESVPRGATQGSSFEKEQRSGDIPDGEVLGDSRNIAQILRETKANRLLITQPRGIRTLVETIALDADLHVTIDVVPEMYEILITQVDSIVGDIPLMRLVTARPSRYQRLVKPLIDRVGAIIALVLLSPVLLIAALAILIDTGRPIFYKQVRVGLKQKDFEVYKLRTMRQDAEKLSGPVLAEEDDPRVTRVGRILRTYRIDELPQLINIMQGSMSFIGPRPERPVFVNEYLETIPGYGERFRIKPGATGLAQINGGYATTPARKLKYDLVYLYHMSASTDIQVIVETLKVVLTGKGAR